MQYLIMIFLQQFYFNQIRGDENTSHSVKNVLNYPLRRIFFIHFPNFRNDQQITAIFYRYPITSAVLSYFSLNCTNALGIELCTVSSNQVPRNPIPRNPRKILYKSSFLLQEFIASMLLSIYANFQLTLIDNFLYLLKLNQFVELNLRLLSFILYITLNCYNE